MRELREHDIAYDSRMVTTGLHKPGYRDLFEFRVARNKIHVCTSRHCGKVPLIPFARFTEQQLARPK